MQAASEQIAVLSIIDPGTVNSTPKTGTYIDMSKYASVMFVFLLGDMASETIDASVLEATSSAGAGAQVLKAATQLAAHATNNDLKQIVIEVKDTNLTAGFRYVAPKLVTGGATGGPASCVGLTYTSRHDPASAGDLSSVVEIKR